MILLLTISTIVIASFVLFFIGVTKVEAIQMNVEQIPQDGLTWTVGTRSSGEITTRSITWRQNNTQFPPSQLAYIPTSSQYWSIGLYYPARKDRIYMIDLYYALGPAGANATNMSNYQLNELTGACTGYNSTCNTGTQTSNYTRLLFDSSTTKINVADASILYNSNNELGLGYSTTPLTMKKLTVILKANEIGPFITLYLNGNNAGYLYIFGAGILDMGESADVLKAYIDSKSQSIMDWTTGKTDDLANQISGIGDQIADLKSNAQNWYTWTTTAIENRYQNTITAINGAKSSLETTMNNNTTSTNNAINSQTTTITNNNNYNTQQQIENYNESQLSCGTGFNDISQTLSASKYYLMNNGTLREHSNFDVSDYIGVNPSTAYTMTIDAPFTESQWASMCQYDENKALISCQQYTTQREQTWTTASNAKWMRFSFIRDGSQIFMLNGYTCTTKSEEDLSASDKNPVNNSGVEGYISSENTLKAQMNTDSLNSFDINIDLNSNNWIWQTMTAFFNTNTAIMTMIISILSIGVIKLVLTR